MYNVQYTLLLVITTRHGTDIDFYHGPSTNISNIQKIFNRNFKFRPKQETIRLTYLIFSS